MQKLQKGFTLVELLVVIGILAILTAVVLVAVNPGRQLAQARNTERSSEINAILTAITAFMADPINNGLPPAVITTTCAGGTTFQKIGTGSGNANLATQLTQTYIAAIPIDPTGNDANTGYEVCTTGSGGANRITVRAPSTEVPPAAATLEVTR